MFHLAFDLPPNLRFGRVANSTTPVYFASSQLNTGGSVLEDTTTLTIRGRRLLKSIKFK
jgi:hypothetical protein